ncbi:Histone-lysine N-methyltransferase, H3 lysine-4 specific [Neolecta irregularis DAH-3]|uniref:Histone-lysine N-methyltransferase, H3 lysine-4 specific n=1 Tax=Neolecta irregularis (strain DAH-3) TaxID=1198029 RepID=A0A1U7LKF8_NEOID|nr:Histone-lysine N-methyltransferase, H3 lysine-4 specific [Neolecta irregularis DAH-3]|eukprot:OLL23129.1 Histone-lysine N-methyltransferase, H3 lysine-4 specific [Neolecta irregularis DAH-3]
MTIIGQDYKPSHPELFKVNFQSGDYASGLFAKKDFKAGDVIAKIEGSTTGPKRYTSVQISKLNSDLVYMNHSCSPTAIIDIEEMVVRANVDIPKHGELTYFYPSTEWDMAQPFECKCGSTKCLGPVTGASKLSAKILGQYQLNKHILDLRASG